MVCFCRSQCTVCGTKKVEDCERESIALLPRKLDKKKWRWVSENILIGVDDNRCEPTKTGEFGTSFLFQMMNCITYAKVYLPFRRRTSTNFLYIMHSMCLTQEKPAFGEGFDIGPRLKRIEAAFFLSPNLNILCNMHSLRTINRHCQWDWHPAYSLVEISIRRLDLTRLWINFGTSTSTSTRVRVIE